MAVGWWRRGRSAAAAPAALLLILAPGAFAGDAPTSMHAIGDSYTAAFGLYGDGGDM